MKRWCLLAAVLMCLRAHAQASGTPAVVSVELEPRTALEPIAADFIGFGYEKSIAAVAGYFSPNNATLINLYRNLSPHGLIRIGGNVSDHTRYVANGARQANAQSDTTTINRDSLAELAGFARATGWKVLWTLNLGTGSREAAAEEATAVDALLRDHLHSFEIGNEVDLRGHYQNTYDDYAGYYRYFTEYKAAVRKALPRAAFSGPDVANEVEWVKNFAGTEAKDSKLLLFHHYRSGAMKPDATMENLLKADDAWTNKLLQLQSIARASGVAFRINEVNSFYGGGKAGVSDVFGSAPWCLDLMFQLASYGADGANLETDINHLAWVSHYSPIFRDVGSGRLTARPEYYGMLAFAVAGRGALIKIDASPTEANLTSYATKDADGQIWVTLINKDLDRDVNVRLKLPAGSARARAYRLEAASVDSKDHVTLAGHEVAADGTWSPGALETLAVENGTANVPVPRVSAALVRLR